MAFFRSWSPFWQPFLEVAATLNFPEVNFSDAERHPTRKTSRHFLSFGGGFGGNFVNCGQFDNL